MSYFITPRVISLYKHYYNEQPLCDAFDYTRVPYYNDTFHIIRSVFNTTFIKFTKCAKVCDFLLLSIKNNTICFHNMDNMSQKFDRINKEPTRTRCLSLVSQARTISVFPRQRDRKRIKQNNYTQADRKLYNRQ